MAAFSRPTASNFNRIVITKILLSGLKNFLIGVSYTTLLTIFKHVQQFFRGTKKNTEFSLKKFLLRALETGTFLSSWTLLHQIIIRVIDQNRERPKASNLVIAGGISGFISMYFTQGMSWQASLYFLLRSLFSVYNLKCKSLPDFVHIPDYLAYCIINFFLGIFSNFYTEYFDKSYMEFLAHCANIKREDAIYMYGGDSKTLPDCCPGYHLQSSCITATHERFYGSFYNNLKVQASFQIFSYVLKGSLLNVQSMNSLMKLIKGLTKNTMRTTLFLTLQCLVCAPLGCINKVFTNRPNAFIMGLVWFIGSFAILFESKSRRTEISIFTIWRLATGLIHILTNVKGYEEHSKEFNLWFSSIIFSIASAFGGYCLSRDKVYF
eukprot:gene10709-3331_t